MDVGDNQKVDFSLMVTEPLLPTHYSIVEAVFYPKQVLMSSHSAKIYKEIEI